MTIEEMFNELENKVRDTVIVTLKYKYDFEETYTIENHILEYDALNDDYVWLNDWSEGQTDIEVLGYMLLGDVDTAKPLTCENPISRESVLEQISCWVNSGEYRYTNATYYLTRRIQGISSVTPQPKIGRWNISATETLDGQGLYECSVCRYLVFTRIDNHYCPNCGAKMTESEE